MDRRPLLPILALALIAGACAGKRDLDVQLVSIDGAEHHACGVDREGVAWCWGDGEDGQLGDGLSTSSSEPVRVVGSARWRSVRVAGGRACGITEDGEAYCWGREAAPPAGAGLKAATETSRPVPTRADVPARLESIAVGEWHACGLDPAGTAWCWGNDIYGELGTEVRGRADTAVAVGGSWQALEAGGHHTCAIDLESAAWCWGDNQFGQSGGDPRERPRGPRLVPQAPPLRGLALGATMTCGLDGAGAAWCWGRGASAGPTSGPVPVPGVGPLRSIDAAGTRACGVDREEGTRCWSGVPREAGSVEELGGTVLAAGVFKGGTCGVEPGGVTCRTPGAGAWPAVLLFMGPLLGVLVVGYERGWTPGWLMATATAAVTAATAALLVPLVGFWHALATDETGWFFIMELGALVGIVALVMAYLSFLGMVVRAHRLRMQ